MKKLFSEARETSIGTIVSVQEASIQGERGLIISGITDTDDGVVRQNICFRLEAASVLNEILNEWEIKSID